MPADGPDLAALGAALRHLIRSSYRMHPDALTTVDAWQDVAGLVGELLVSQQKYGATVARTQRNQPMSLAAEMRWGLLPPLTFRCPDVALAGIVHPSLGNGLAPGGGPGPGPRRRRPPRRRAAGARDVPTRPRNPWNLTTRSSP